MTMKNIENWVWDLNGIFYRRTKEFYQNLHSALALHIADNKIGSLNYEQALRLAKTSPNCFQVFIDAYQVSFEDLARPTYDRMNLSFIKPNYSLNKQLQRMGGTHVIFTSSTVDWTKKVLRRKGVEDIFPDQNIIALTGSGHHKSQPETYPWLLETRGFEASRTCISEDTQKYLGLAKQAGMVTTLLHSNEPQESYTDYKFDRLNQFTAFAVKQRMTP